MSLVHGNHSLGLVADRIARIRDWAITGIGDSRIGLFLGLGAATLAGTPLPLFGVAIAGPVIATLAAGTSGGRAAAAVGFIAYLAAERPSTEIAILAGAIACLVGWGVPWLLGREDDSSDASAILVDCDGFSSLDQIYGEGSSDHAFDLLQRAMKMEATDGDLVVHIQDRELVLVVGGVNQESAQRIMAKVERRFAAWLSDAGYECHLTVGISAPDRFASLRRIAYGNGPYLD